MSTVDNDFLVCYSQNKQLGEKYKSPIIVVRGRKRRVLCYIGGGYFYPNAYLRHSTQMQTRGIAHGRRADRGQYAVAEAGARNPVLLGDII